MRVMPDMAECKKITSQFFYRPIQVLSMSKNNGLIILKIVILSLFLCILSVCGIMLINHRINTQRYHVYCELLRSDMTRVEAEQLLSKEGSFHLQVDKLLNVEYIGFVSPLNAIALGQIMLVFDENDHLKWASRQVGPGDWGPGADCNRGR
jgi:hypothetical protein